MLKNPTKSRVILVKKRRVFRPREGFWEIGVGKPSFEAEKRPYGRPGTS